MSDLTAELSPRTAWHVTRHIARDKRSIAPGPLERMCWHGDSSRCSEEIVKKKLSNCAFKCDYYYYYSALRNVFTVRVMSRMQKGSQPHIGVLTGSVGTILEYCTQGCQTESICDLFTWMVFPFNTSPSYVVDA